MGRDKKLTLLQIRDDKKSESLNIISLILEKQNEIDDLQFLIVQKEKAKNELFKDLYRVERIIKKIDRSLSTQRGY